MGFGDCEGRLQRAQQQKKEEARGTRQSRASTLFGQEKFVPTSSHNFGKKMSISPVLISPTTSLFLSLSLNTNIVISQAIQPNWPSHSNPTKL